MQRDEKTDLRNNPTFRRLLDALPYHDQKPFKKA